MIYLGDGAVRGIGSDWLAFTEVIRRAVECLAKGDFAQPIKPYLRYRDPQNRIIAMPAFVGGDFDRAGIKWIASFPDNIQRGLARAHSVIVLNEAATGVPTAIINTPRLSALRTAAVSGLVLCVVDAARNFGDFRLGMTGFGPIGQTHLAMVEGLFGDRLREVKLYDPRLDGLPEGTSPKVRIARSYREAYDDADVFITCTVARSRYVDARPKPGSCHLNVSLRDYDVGAFAYFRDAIVVDDFAEVCRENTDIELFHQHFGLAERDVSTLVDLVVGQRASAFAKEQPILFNPMGMAVFDVAMATHVVERARALGLGVELDDAPHASA